tara:strand:+ start:88 stop:612 length:525 start_codon:yes stop_codon:yes gene_type:complete
MSWLDCSDCHIESKDKKDFEYFTGTNIENASRNYSISQNVGNNKILSRTKVDTGIHNNEIYAPVMPAKFQSADGSARFRRGRRVFNSTGDTSNLYAPQIKKGGKLLGIDGQDRSSGSYIERRKAMAIGKGSYSQHTEHLAFARRNINDSIRARRRARSGGSVAPAKKGAIRRKY